MAGTVAVTDDTFAQLVIAAHGLVVVDFWAAWCGPCRALTPALERVVAQYADRVSVLKLDVDANPATAAQFRVRSIPSLLFFLDGALVDRTVGALPESIIRVKIDQILRGRTPLPAV